MQLRPALLWLPPADLVLCRSLLPSGYQYGHLHVAVAALQLLDHIDCHTQLHSTAWLRTKSAA